MVLAQNERTTINRGNGAEPDSLNPYLAQGLNSQNILLDLYEGLMTFDINAQPVYGAAISHQVNHDKTIWTFTLNPNAKWSDGQSVTADDFINGWNYAYDPKTAAPYRGLFDNWVIDSKLQISSNGSNQLTIQLNQPDSGLLNKLVLPVFFPKPIHSDSNSISNGAYFLKEWRIQEIVVLEKNPYFHSSEQVKTDNINYWVTENQNSELLRFRANEIDITETIPDNKIDWLKQNLPDSLRIYPYYGTFFLGLNLNDKQLQDPHLRQALSLAIDRNILVEKVLKTGQIPANRIIPQKSQSDKNSFNFSMAKKALSQSNFNTKSDQLEILYNSSSNQKKVALAIAAMWRQNLGIKSKLKNQEWKVFVNTRKGQNKQVFRSGWIADYYDPLNFLELFHSQSHFNFYGYYNKQYDQIINQLRIQDDEKKVKLIDSAENLIQSDIPVIPLYHYVSRHLVDVNVKGFVDNEMDRHLSRYLEKQRP